MTWQICAGWRLYGAGTFLEMQLHRRPGLDRGAEAAEGQSPSQQVYLQSSWDLPRNLLFDLSGRWVDRLRGFNLSTSSDPSVPNQIPAYFSIDASLTWRSARNLDVSLVGQNLLDRHHPEFGTSPVVRSPLVEIKRGVHAKVTWRF